MFLRQMISEESRITQYYCKLYTGEENKLVESFIDQSRYDYVLYFEPDVKWVSDGYRWNKDDDVRKKLNEMLLEMYKQYGFSNKLIKVDGSYLERMEKSKQIVTNILNK